MRKTFKISVYLTETDSNYVFTFKVIGKPIKHKFVLTFSRVFFEFPYNEIAKDVLRLREIGIFNNINYSHNKELLDKCEVLRGYSLYNEKFREYNKLEEVNKTEAAHKALDYCIQHNVLADFFKKRRKCKFS